ncbi:hypothetical protein VC83_02594 [Pseudogymnoascus destructans]|uniref:Uncharacterized protein n=1 Tax=Pseudogymnoascus destructans TaxID=655981 RepID=A0A177AHY1_9PEZI|nr:uncharacterized protein VC83_02594 [Pseudogymnoascus destructans]OAF60774.1 hypothetical protein VC83_02594 [Pseudogymnoascus destructans]
MAERLPEPEWSGGEPKRVKPHRADKKDLDNEANAIRDTPKDGSSQTATRGKFVVVIGHGFLGAVESIR